MSGTPGAFAREIIRVEDEPIPVNYKSSRIGGNYSAQCPDCNSWIQGYSKEGAIKEAKICCGNYDWTEE